MRKAPQGGRLREVAPVGGAVINPTKAIPVARQRRLPIAPVEATSGSRSHQVQPTTGFPEEARRIARSSSGHTARGRGFRMY